MPGTPFSSMINNMGNTPDIHNHTRMADNMDMDTVLDIIAQNLRVRPTLRRQMALQKILHHRMVSCRFHKVLVFDHTLDYTFALPPLHQFTWYSHLFL